MSDIVVLNDEPTPQEREIIAKVATYNPRIVKFTLDGVERRAVAFTLPSGDNGTYYLDNTDKST